MRNPNFYSEHYTKKIKQWNNFTKLTSIFICFILLATGILLYLGNNGYIEPKIINYIFSWQTLLITIGLLFLLVSKFRIFFGPIVLIIVGLVFLFQKINGGELSRNIWAYLLICSSIIIFLKIILPRKNKYFHKQKYTINEQNGDQVNTDDFLKFSRNFTNVSILSESKNFKGGQISLSFSEGKLNLQNAELAEGNNLLIIESVFSNLKIILPKNWDISYESSGAFGGIHDQRSLIIFNNANSNNRLIIKADIVFSGIELLN
ncbi:MAG: LiaF-related protein [Bacteroidales bacterium]|jgi:predicted membrane protein|nr:LiaF-related protein [Bacteroidales bacterium]